MGNDQNKNEELMQKNVAYYSVMLSAFIESRNEVDRQILTLSVASIGGILAFHEKLIGTCLGLSLTILSLVSFMFTIASVLYIFDKNSDYINKELRGDYEDAVKVSEYLKTLDRLAYGTFIASILFSCILIISSFYK